RTAGGLGREAQAGQVPKPLAVEGVVLAPRLDPLVEYPQLPAPDRREQVAQAVVVADHRVLVVRRRVPRLRRQKASPVDPFLAVGDQRPAPAGGDDLVAVEGEDRRSEEHTSELQSREK